MTGTIRVVYLPIRARFLMENAVVILRDASSARQITNIESPAMTTKSYSLNMLNSQGQNLAR